ncbi:TPA: ATP-binding protein, partial [Enterobacter hormaechei]|nr:ATP-binding protein [Enterobacter hormaechei]
LTYPESLILPGDINDLKKIRVMFFSNVFDANYIDFPDEVVDISLNAKMNPKNIHKNSFRRLESVLEKQIRFLGSHAARKIKLQPPTKIEYRISRTIKESLRGLSRKNNFQSSSDEAISELSYISEGLQRIFLREVRKIGRDNLFNLSITIIKQQFIASLINPGSKVDYCIADILEIVSSLLRDDETSTDVILQAILDESQSRDSIYNYTENHIMSEVVGCVLLNLKSIFESLNFTPDSSLRNSKIIFSLDYSECSNWQHQKLSSMFEVFWGCNASWSGLSSGQKAYLNIFSLVWAAISEGEHSRDEMDSVICIDEGDLYLHPQWQIDFLQTLIRSLPEISKGKIQIVFTTHSPLLVSDVPKQCLLILNGNNSQLNMLEDINTFGANFYDIYSKAFGLKGVRSASISNSYISEILHILDKETLTKCDIKKLNESLGLIGDELVLHHIRKRIS